MVKKVTTIDVTGNEFIDSNPLTTTVVGSKSTGSTKKGYIRNCYIACKKNDTMFYVNDYGDGPVIVATLEGYAIIPKDDFSEYLKWKNRKKKINVLNIGGK